jgi:hypothetical protein
VVVDRCLWLAQADLAGDDDRVEEAVDPLAGVHVAPAVGEQADADAAGAELLDEREHLGVGTHAGEHPAEDSAASGAAPSIVVSSAAKTSSNSSMLMSPVSSGGSASPSRPCARATASACA